MKRALLERVQEARSRGAAVVVITRVSDGEQWVLLPLEGGDAGAAAPGADDLASGGDADEPPAAGDDPAARFRDLAERAALLDRSGVHDVDGEEHFFQVYNPPLRMVVVGAVHIAQALAPMAALAGFAVSVVDPRRAWATETRFPGVELVRSWPDEALPAMGLDHRTALVTLSHDPKLDDPALAAGLESRAFYVGALGSRRTHARRVGRLRERGFGEDDIERIHAPVGLDIGAVSPAEIAVATLAQVIGALREGAGATAVAANVPAASAGTDAASPPVPSDRDASAPAVGPGAGSAADPGTTPG